MDKLTISDAEVVALSPEGQEARLSVPEFVKALASARPDTGNAVLPDGVKAQLARGKAVVWVHQTPPRVASLRWIARDSPRPYGPGARYRDVTVALPYVIVLAVFAPGPDGLLQLGGVNECFFRNDPLASLDDPVFYPALLNCSKFPNPAGRPLAWICTQYLPRDGFAREADESRRMRLGLKELLRCLFDTGFNLSSEHHEGNSWYQLSSRADPRLATIEAWQEATTQDPLFALTVPWLPTDLSVRQVVDRTFTNLKAQAPPLASAADLARVVFNHGKRS